MPPTRSTTNYNDVHELTRYVWRHYRHLLTDFERRVGKTILGREKAEAADNEKLAERLRTSWGQVDNPEIEAALKEGHENFLHRAAQRALREHADEIVINRCPNCDRVVASPKAQQCLWCKHDWHKSKEA